jgi:hypothetical protein
MEGLGQAEMNSRNSIPADTKPVTLRINQLDLIKIKAKARRKHIPHQTLLRSLLHEFAETGELGINLVKRSNKVHQAMKKQSNKIYYSYKPT